MHRQSTLHIRTDNGTIKWDVLADTTVCEIICGVVRGMKGNKDGIYALSRDGFDLDMYDKVNELGLGKRSKLTLINYEELI
jgi:hypothetical protein